MAILPVTAELIAAFVIDHGVGGRCLQLARQEVRLSRGELRRMLQRVGTRRDTRHQAVTAALARLDDDAAADTAAISDREFFKVLGFAVAPSVDASTFEQADCIHDMNVPGLPDKLGSPVDMAVETGTAEHVFNIPQYLRNVCESLKVGGSVLHFVPAHSYLDHGFYQFSPTLFFDFYRANRFDLLDLILIETASEDWSHGRITRYVPGAFDRRDRHRFAERYVILGIAARKRADSTCDAIPQQRIYAASAGWAADDAVDLLAQTTELVRLDGPYVHDVGACWRVPAPSGAGAGDTVDRPRRSRLLVCEDGRPLGPAHARHEDIRTLGQGRFSHWGEQILFAASDAGDPNRNGHRYTLRMLPSEGIGAAFDTTVQGFETMDPDMRTCDGAAEVTGGFYFRLRQWCRRLGFVRH